MKSADLIRALSTVPETHLRLPELAQKCAGPDGKFDMKLCIPIAAEISVAVEEMQAYVHETGRVRSALSSLMDR